MNETEAFEVLIDWNFWGNFRERLKPRDIIPSIMEKNALVIKGIRRSGKSSLSFLIAKKFDEKDTLIINLEDPRLRYIEAKDLIKFLEIYQRNVNLNGPKLMILDEVQNLEGWEKVVRFFTEARKINVIVTGSSSKLMSEEYATVLTGRHIDFELFPLSFREILTWNNISIDKLSLYKNKVKILAQLDNFLNFGGFPRVVLEDKRYKFDILRQYFDDILMKDVVKRFGIKEIEKLENLAMIYLSNISTLQSKNKLKEILNISLDTVERFSKYFSIARLFFFIPKFSYSLKQQILSIKKVYCIDVGFFNALGFKFSKNKGRIMENVVAVDLLRRKSYQHKNWELFYWRDYQHNEVDFVVKEGMKIKQLIQVTYASSWEDINNREIKSLLKASDKLNCDDLLVITWDYEAKENVNNKKVIKFIPLYKWLLSKS